MEVEENHQEVYNKDSKGTSYENVPLKAGKKYLILVRAHVDQVSYELE